MISLFALIIMFWIIAYKRVREGINQCPKGYESIKDEVTCKAASKIFSLKYTGGSVGGNSVCFWCGGCTPKSVIIKENSGGNAQWLCKRKGYMNSFIPITSISLINEVKYFSTKISIITVPATKTPKKSITTAMTLATFKPGTIFYYWKK